MPIPTHSAYGCRTRMWPMPCRGCKERVWFLTCTCGSKVLLNEPRPPWSRHSDTCVDCMAEEVSNTTDRTATQVKRWIQDESRRRNVALPAEARRILYARANRETGGTTVVRVTPGGEVERGETIAVTATVFEINGVNVFKRSRMADSVVGRKLMGELGKGPVVELVLRGQRDPDTGFVDEVPVLTLRETWRDSGLRQHEKAKVDFALKELPNGFRFWLARLVKRPNP